ncbi:MAG: hypothetical protein U0232_15145 [Thermomicrobiales bacterium]
MAEIEALLSTLTGAEATLVVNNNAAATTLTAALAVGRQVILSRGEAVEIGGGFRIPDVMRCERRDAGRSRHHQPHLHPRLRGRDHRRNRRITESPRQQLRVIGFTHEAFHRRIRRASPGAQPALIHAIGSGALRDTALRPGHEPTVSDSLRDGASVVLFSGDKLGGPQAGIAGDRALVARIARHPLARAVRTDKATLAGIAATLRHFLRGEESTHVPVRRMISTSRRPARPRAERWQATPPSAASPAPSSRACSPSAAACPRGTLPTWALAFDAATLAAHRPAPDNLRRRPALRRPANRRPHRRRPPPPRPAHHLRGRGSALAGPPD